MVAGALDALLTLSLHIGQVAVGSCWLLGQGCHPLPMHCIARVPPHTPAS